MSKLDRKVYHTQERRCKQLTFPRISNRPDCWLGKAYYFWYSEEYADLWGMTSKRSTGGYEVYTCQLSGENFLDTAFNEEERNFFTQQINKVANTFIAKTSRKPDIKYICKYLNNNAGWKEKLDGIVIEDTPGGRSNLIDAKKYTYPYKKRTQVGVFNRNCIKDFRFLKEKSL
ncbi:MAG: hypothetical protein LKF48_09215 [Prevotella sp.]|jgi:hypothetical protein|nr:hypothetical protein [Prevotella sp.]MCH4183320.1 hypothetical protein [Prevotella sp.]MCH4242108.1 hypothetical protein [Prevotella sp.]